jgi:hypothetical protein
MHRNLSQIPSLAPSPSRTRARSENAFAIAFLACAVALCLPSADNANAATNTSPLKLNFEPNLPVVVLECKQPINHEQRKPCTLRIMGPDTLNNRASNALPASIRIHGGVSQGFAKKSYGVTLAAPARLLDMRESAHWVLNAAYIDRSLMRHKLSYDLFRSLSAPNAARHAVASRFVEVYLNADYQGAYLLMERIDRQLLQLRSFGSNEAAHACIYKAVDHTANFSQPGYAGYEQREPDALTRPYWQPLEEFNQFVTSAADPDFFAPDHGVASKLELNNAIDFHLLVLLTCNLDGITKNFILARDAPASGSLKPRFFFAPWDYDGTFGQNWDASPVGPDVWLSNHLFDRLMSDRAYRARFAQRWGQLRAREFSVQNIHEMIDANLRTLGEAARRNWSRWGGAGEGYPNKLSFEQDLAGMKHWVEARTRWLDQEIARRCAP